jgi:hypothetical protein
MTLNPQSGTDFIVEDWRVLFEAVMARLSASVQGLPDQPGPQTIPALRTTVLDCVDALAQLQQAALHQLEHRAARDAG